MTAQAAVRDILESGDHSRLAAFWAQVHPELPQPRPGYQSEVMLHLTRTETESVSLAKRVYSHRWLTERGLPSKLPDELRPASEQVHPVIVSAVGVSVRASSPARVEVAAAAERAMADTVAEMYADGVEDPAVVRARMLEIGRGVLRQG